MEILTLITAREGSKGLPGKNIKMLLDKPLIAWTIELAKSLNFKTDIIVSTDGEEIAKVSKEYGAMVPFMRPKELAGDSASSMEVIQHAVDSLEKKYDVILLLEPTSPIREKEDIEQALKQLLESADAESIVGVAKAEGTHPDFMTTLENGFLKPINSDRSDKRRQDLNDVYYFEGSFYISYVNSLLDHGGFYHEKTLGYPLDKWKSFEIDDMTDFVVVEGILKAKKEGRI